VVGQIAFQPHPKQKDIELAATLLARMEQGIGDGSQRWLGLSAQGSATDKWIVCRLLG
jgi:hypothetical protein